MAVGVVVGAAFREAVVALGWLRWVFLAGEPSAFLRQTTAWRRVSSERFVAEPFVVPIHGTDARQLRDGYIGDRKVYKVKRRKR